MDININPGSINEHFHTLIGSEARYNIIYGGSSSSKSYSMMSYIVLWALQGRSVLVTRKVASTISSSVWAEIIKAIDRDNLRKYFEINKSEKLIVCKFTSGCIKFVGADDIEKLKSITPPKGVSFHDVVMEEATEFSEPDFNQLLLRQRGKKGVKVKTKYNKRIWLLFNPVFKTHWIYTRFFKEVEKDVDFSEFNLDVTCDKVRIHKSTYRDNEYLEQEDIDTLNDMAKYSVYHSYVYRDGGFGILGKRIFDTNVEYVDHLDDNKMGYSWRVGIDSGWNDYQVCTLALYNGKNICIVESIGFREMAIDDFADRVKSMFVRHGVPSNQLIIADSSHPRDNKSMRLQGLNVKKAVKGPGSKYSGIMFLKTKLITVPASETQFKEAIEIYQWKTDKNGVSIDEPLHEGSDWMDALRYSLEIDAKGAKTHFGKM